MAGRKHRVKGDRIEREIVDAHRAIGRAARRVPQSGSARDFPGDVLIEHEGSELTAEVKARKGGAGFVQLERWLGSNDVLFLRRNHAEPIVVLPWSTWAKLIASDEGSPR